MVAHRAGVLTVAVVAVAMLFAIGSWEVYAKPTVHYKCYKIVPSGPPPNEEVTLVDQFDTEDVTVRAAYVLCAPALKDGEGTFAVPHLKCYDLSQSPALDVEVTLVDQFGTEEVTVREPLLLCEEVTKTLR